MENTGEGRIARPPKVYLDTNHLINIAKSRAGEKLQGQSSETYLFIDEYVRKHCGLIFSWTSPLEWVEGDATEKSANAIAAIFESVKLVYMIEGDTFVYTREVLDECKRQNTERVVPQFDMMHIWNDGGSFRSALGVLGSTIPGYVEKDVLSSSVQNQKDISEVVPVVSFPNLIKEHFKYKKRNLAIYEERVKGFNESLQYDIDHAEEFFANSSYFITEWFKRHLKIDRILLALNPGIDVNEVLNTLDIEKCPAVKLFIHTREKRLRDKSPPKDNDVDDWFFLPVIPYADLVLTDRNFRHFILQADESLESKVFADASEAAQALKNLSPSW
jgi:hypothetical protein